MIAREHEIHRRRFGRNAGVGLCLAAFAVLLFAVSAVKVSTLGPVEGFDHAVRPALEVSQ